MQKCERKSINFLLVCFYFILLLLSFMNVVLYYFFFVRVQSLCYCYFGCMIFPCSTFSGLMCLPQIYIQRCTLERIYIHGSQVTKISIKFITHNTAHIHKTYTSTYTYKYNTLIHS